MAENESVYNAASGELCKYISNEQHNTTVCIQPLGPSTHMSPLSLSGVQCAQMSEQSQDRRSVGRFDVTWNIYHCSQNALLWRNYLGCQGGCEDNYIGQERCIVAKVIFI